MPASATPVISNSSAFQPFADFGALRFHGPEAQKFLQGQLSNDMALLRAGAILRAGLHNPQGRAIALLWLAASAPDDILALLPLELVAPVAAHLRRYLLRARLAISDASAETRLYGLRCPVPPAADGCWSFDAQRALLIGANDDATANSSPGAQPLTREQWRQLDVAAGVPQIYAATSAQFVAQMLNLDCIDAISFSKGCYTGQEVIARAHYRGRVKRRMQRFETLEPTRLAPGDAGALQDGRSFRVVESSLRPDGSSEFLAVAALSAAGRDAPEADSGAGATTPAAQTAALRMRQLPLAYALPE
jgi:tRNA-modifying protein YgfZ